MSAMESGLDIRPMENKYIDDVLAIYNKIRGARTADTKSSRRSIDRGILTYEEVASTDLGGPLDLSFIAEVNGQIVGFIWGRLAYVGIPVQEVGFIHMIIVDPDHQRRGIARALINALVERCSVKGINTIRTVVGERDWELGNFFNEVGFEYSGLVIYTRTVES